MLYEKKIPIVVNSRLEVFHQYHGERSDLVIKKENIPGYNMNSEYFVTKHPEALNLPKEKALELLRGENNKDIVYIDNSTKYIEIDFKDREKLDHLKNLILAIPPEKQRLIVINDYVEDTDLDIWIQLPKENGYITAKYYPVSKRIDRKDMLEFLRNEKQRQAGQN